MTTTNPREEKGKEIASQNNLVRINDSLYHVKSPSDLIPVKSRRLNDLSCQIPSNFNSTIITPKILYFIIMVSIHSDFT